MEVIYVWTSGYKNLKGGYLLSDKYNVRNNDGIISVDKNKNYFDGFYGKNDQVTGFGVLGKNGSGKSSIFKLILLLLKEDRAEINSLDPSIIVFEADNKIFYISSNDELYFKGDTKIRRFRSTQKSGKKIRPFTIYFNYMADSLMDSSSEQWVDRLYHRNDFYKTSILLEPNKKGGVIDIGNIEYLNKQRILTMTPDQLNNSFMKSVFKPHAVSMKIDVNKLSRIALYLSENKNIKIPNELMIVINEVADNYQRNKYMDKRNRKKSIDKNTISKNYHSKLELYVSSISIKTLNEIYILYKTDKLSNNINKVELSELPEFSIRKLGYAKDFGRRISFFKNKINSKILLSDLPCKIPSWFLVEIHDSEGISFDALSSGQKAVFTLFSTIHYHVKNISESKSDILLMLDEVDLGLHPEWQRRIVHGLVELLSSYSGLNFHFLFSSHSPFVASDFDKKRLILLDDGVVRKLPEDVETLGNNIHKLLSDSFFLNRGCFMGEFSRLKIEEAFIGFESIFDKYEKYLISDSVDRKDMKVKIINELEEILSKAEFHDYMSKHIGESYIAKVLFSNIQRLHKIRDHFMVGAIPKSDRDELKRMIGAYPDLARKMVEGRD